MRVSPDPYHVNDASPEPAEAREPARRPEGVRIALYIFIYLLPAALSSWANWQWSSRLVYGNAPFGWSTGEAVLIASYAATYLLPLLVVLLCKPIVFRSRLPWWKAAVAAMGATFLWQMVSALVRAFAARNGAETLVQASSILSVLWPVLLYLFQRFLLFRRTLDTLPTNAKETPYG